MLKQLRHCYIFMLKMVFFLEMLLKNYKFNYLKRFQFCGPPGDGRFSLLGINRMCE